MSSTGKTISRDILHAYVDGELTQEMMAEMERHLAVNPDDAALVAAFRRDREALHALYGHVEAEPVPAALSAHRIARSRRRELTRWGLTGWSNLAAACLAVAVVASAGGWYARGLVSPAASMRQALVDNAVAAHNLYVSEIVHPVEVAASQEEHLAAWLSKRLDRAIVIPDLRDSGFDLVGGRLLPDGSGPAAQFMYEDRSGRRVTLYVKPTPETGQSAFRFVEEGRTAAVFWRDETISCSLVGELARNELEGLAKRAYEQLG